MTYYRELMENEYEERITQWHDTCKWFQPYGKTGQPIKTWFILSVRLHLTGLH